jgi:3-hydroxyacyl-CoA dehydrogenase/3-hydroxy-2-methylbutyryl-CoA dehydrogenase
MAAKGLVCMVTGGASGLGKATAEHFAKQGYKVVIGDLPSSAGAKVASDMGAQNAAFSPLDVTSEESVKATVALAKTKFGRLDVLVNCAGIGVAYRTYNINKRSMHVLADFQRVINVNLVGSFNTIRVACDAFADNTPNKDGQRGVIVNTASVAAYDGQIGQAAYAASKGMQLHA